MDDLDILVQMNDVPRIRHLLENHGYIVTHQGDLHPFELEFLKIGGINIDVHFALFNPAILDADQTPQLYKHIWNHRKMIAVGSLHIPVMPEEDELINQIIHLARHLILSGARLSHIFDIALLTKKCGSRMDWRYIANNLEILGLKRFAEIILAACREFFDTGAPEGIFSQTAMYPVDFLDAFFNGSFENFKIAEHFSRGKYRIWFRKPASRPLAFSLELLEQLILYKNGFAASISNAEARLNKFFRKNELLNLTCLSHWDIPS